MRNSVTIFEHRGWVFCILAVCVVACGCAGHGGSEASEYTEPFGLTIVLDKQVYQPGEVIVVSVQLVNHSGGLENVRFLDRSAVTFWFGPIGITSRYKRAPVYSEKDTQTGMVALENNQVINRNFVFTDLTEEPGDYLFQAIYSFSMDDEESEDEGMQLISRAVSYRVAGQRVFERQDLPGSEKNIVKGLITEEEAVAVVVRALGIPVIRSRAILIKDEAGFFQWWVTVELPITAIQEGGSSYLAYFVNPYLGRIRKEAAPFNLDEGGESRQRRETFPLPTIPGGSGQR